MKIIKIKTPISTNDKAMELLSKKHIPKWTIISSDNQIKGKGRRGRIWESEAFKNIAISIIIEANISLDKVFYLNIISSLSIKKILDKHLGSIYIKWPNDIICNNKKICGILIENIIRDNRICNSVIGIGLNVNQTTFPNYLKNKATSMKIESQKSFKRENLIHKIAKKLKRYHKILQSNSFDELINIYNDSLYKVGPRN